VLGGAKVSDKIAVLDAIMSRVDGLIIGGAMANTFLAAKGLPTGKSLVEHDKLALARTVLARAEERKVELLLPEDVVVASGLDGLTLTSNGALLSEGAVKANESRTFEVDFKRGPGRTNLAVSVRGTFNGAPLARVVTFAMGEGPLQQNGTTVITDDGEAIKVMNAQ
jgi:hypothetical protein